MKRIDENQINTRHDDSFLALFGPPLHGFLYVTKG